jgi:hypothetical protein
MRQQTQPSERFFQALDLAQPLLVAAVLQLRSVHCVQVVVVQAVVLRRAMELEPAVLEDADLRCSKILLEL